MGTTQLIGDPMPEPKTPSEGRWIARPGKPSWIWPAFIPMFSIPIVNIFLLLPGPWSGHFALKLALSMAAFMLVVIAVGALMMFDHKRMLGHLRTRPIPDGSIADEFVAEVTIVVGGRKIGIDRGLVWFAEGLMGFSGAATSFVLAAWDIELQRIPRMATMTESAIPAGAIVLVDAPRPAYVLVLPFGRNRGIFRQRLLRFERESGGQDEERFWPPLSPYSEARPLGHAVRP